MSYGYEGEKVRLVPMDLDLHLTNAQRWMNDVRVTEWLFVGDFPMTRIAEEAWFQERMTAGPSEANFAIELLDGTHIGFSGLFKIDFKNRTAHSGSIIAPEFWSNGYGTDAVRIRADYAFRVLGLKTLYTSYLAENERSGRMQAAAGYTIWGRQPNAIWKRGKMRDLVHTFLSSPIEFV
jgi:RimJ/RimL family protein N-acetyltransferase